MRFLRAWAPVAIGALLAAAYANHFGNGFHFDDDHAIVSNPYVRQLTFVPRVFVDATTFSVLPANQMYRPVAQTTFAVDYAIGQYDPRIFQADTFIWFVALLAAIYALTDALTGLALPSVVATALFGLHPAIADTVNYIVQRGEVLAALGVVVSLVLYVRGSGRSSALYLLPAMAGLLAKQTAAAFPAILASYLWIYADDRARRRDLAVCVVAIAAESLWMLSRTPAGARYFSATPGAYVATQPFVALRYFAAFFAPVSLSADPDWPAVTGAGDPTLWVGLGFVAVVAVGVWRLRRNMSTRVVAFGLAWFLVAQLPTALVPLAEVGNDWRMFLPFIGLAIAVAGAAWYAVDVWAVTRMAAGRSTRLYAWTVLVAAILVVEAVGVHARNEVWRTDETLWRDAIAKNALNARAWMNYGVALMARGDYAAAADACERALPLAPNYPLLHVNLGVAYGAVGRRVDANREFLAAQRLAPDDWRTHVYYGAWLEREGRLREAQQETARARVLNPVAMSNQ